MHLLLVIVYASRIISTPNDDRDNIYELAQFYLNHFLRVCEQQLFYIYLESI